MRGIELINLELVPFIYSPINKKLTIIEEIEIIISINDNLNEPISKIIYNKEFYSLDFFVDKNVLDPRPESEFIIETAKKIFKSKKQRCFFSSFATYFTFISN